MARWVYTIDMKPVWSKYSDLSHEEFDEDEELFNKMKSEMVGQLKKEMHIPDLNSVSEIVKKLESAKHLSSFSNHWNRLYDYCDFRKIWLKTEF